MNINQSYHHSQHVSGSRYDHLDPHAYWHSQEWNDRHHANPLQGLVYGHYTRYDHPKEGDDGHPFTFKLTVVLITASFKPLTNLE